MLTEYNQYDEFEIEINDVIGYKNIFFVFCEYKSHLCIRVYDNYVQERERERERERDRVVKKGNTKQDEG